MPKIHPIIVLTIHCILEQMPKSWESSRSNVLLSLFNNLSDFEVKCILFFSPAVKLNLQPREFHDVMFWNISSTKTTFIFWKQWGSSFLKYRTIRSYKHILKTIEINKKCLSAYDDKRYIFPDGVHTLAHGHFRIEDLNAQVGVHEMEVDERMIFYTNKLCTLMTTYF